MMALVTDLRSGGGLAAGTATLRAGLQPGPHGESESRAVPRARARGPERRGVRVDEFIAAERGIAAERFEPGVAVLAGETAAPFGDNPVPPAGLRIVRRVQLRPRTARQAA